MPLVLKTQDGKDKAPDLEAFFKTMTPAQIAMFVSLFEFTIEERSGATVIEMYNEVQKIWNDMTPDARRRAAAEGEDRFFTVEAYERTVQEAQADKRAAEQSRIILTDGNPGGKGH